MIGQPPPVMPQLPDQQSRLAQMLANARGRRLGWEQENNPHQGLASMIQRYPYARY
jgi:hypothetical protein